jgi:hypothetical protein
MPVRYLVDDPVQIPDGGRASILVIGFIFPLGMSTCVRVQRTHIQSGNGYKEQESQVRTLTSEGPHWRYLAEARINPDAAQVLLRSTPWKVIKIRRRAASVDAVIETYRIRNEGLVIAEFDSARERQHLPSWCSIDITHDARYRDDNLAFHPYDGWKPEEH